MEKPALDTAKRAKQMPALTREETEFCFRELEFEFHHGVEHLAAYERLNEAEEAFPDVMEAFGGFFRNALMAHLELSFLHAARMFDSSKREAPVSFKTFLCGVLDHPDIFEHQDPRAVRRQARADLGWASEANNEDVKALLDLRHNALAHYGEKRMRGSDRDRLESFFQYDVREPALLQRLYREAGERIERYHEWQVGMKPWMEPWPGDEMELFATIRSALRLLGAG